MSIQNLLNTLNVWQPHGTIELITEPDDREGFNCPDLKDSDVLVYFNYMDDDMSDDEREVFGEWYYDELPNKLNDEMNKLGYFFHYDTDGSGGGLHYGGMLFRKK